MDNAIEKVTFSRKQLYELVWSQPITSLCKAYDITNFGLKRICEKMKIPLPRSGYWGKIKFGKKVSWEELPPFEGAESVTFSIKKEGVQSKVLSPTEILQQEIEGNPNLNLVVTSKLINPDKLIIAVKDRLSKQKTSLYGKGLVYSSVDNISIEVSPENVNRALLFMDAFVKLIKARGHNILIENGTYIVINEQKLKISLREKLKRVMVEDDNTSWKRAEDSPSGILVFRYIERAYRTVDWKDGKLLPIEKQLSKILASLELKAVEIEEENIRYEKESLESEKKEQQRLKLQKRHDNELKAFKELLDNSNRWHLTKILRSYIDDVAAKSPSDGIISEKIKKWLDWARKKADWFDPQIESKDNLLTAEDRKEIFEEPDRSQSNKMYFFDDWKYYKYK